MVSLFLSHSGLVLFFRKLVGIRKQNKDIKKSKIK